MSAVLPAPGTNLETEPAPRDVDLGTGAAQLLRQRVRVEAVSQASTKSSSASFGGARTESGLGRPLASQSMD